MQLKHERTVFMCGCATSLSTRFLNNHPNKDYAEIVRKINSSTTAEVVDFFAHSGGRKTEHIVVGDLSKGKAEKVKYMLFNYEKILQDKTLSPEDKRFAYYITIRRIVHCYAQEEWANDDSGIFEESCVTVKFSLLPDGKVASLKKHSSPQNEKFEKYAENAIYKANELFPEFPVPLNEMGFVDRKEIWFTIRIAFECGIDLDNEKQKEKE